MAGAALALTAGWIGLGPAPAALASWSVQQSGTAAGAAATMPTGGAPTGSARLRAVTVRWPVADLSSGTAVAGYTIQRFNAVNGQAATVGPGCSGVISTNSCTESSVPPGSWTYTDTPVQQSWTGGQSPASAPVTVSPT